MRTGSPSEEQPVVQRTDYALPQILDRDHESNPAGSTQPDVRSSLPPKSYVEKGL